MPAPGSSDLGHAGTSGRHLDQGPRRQDVRRPADVDLLVAAGRHAGRRSRAPEDQRRAQCRRSSTSTPTRRSFRRSNGSLITDKLWGIYYKPDFYFGGVQGGAMPFKIKTPPDKVAVDPYGPESPDFIVGDDFKQMWVLGPGPLPGAVLGPHERLREEPSGGIGCFTPDNFPIFDQFCENVYVIADSNHGYKMVGVGELVAKELTGAKSKLLDPFRFARYAEGELHPVSNSPYPWS